MYLNVGKDFFVNSGEIVGVFDLDKITVYKVNRFYLSKMEKRGKIINITENIPKSFVVCSSKKESKVYLSGLMPSTIYKRNVSGQKNIGEVN